LIVNKLSNDHVVWRRNRNSLIGKHLHHFAAEQLRLLPTTLAGYDEVDLLTRRWMNDIEPRLPVAGTFCSRFTDVKFIAGKRAADCWHLRLDQLNQDVYVLRKSGLSPNSASERPDNRIGNLQPLKTARSEYENVTLLYHTLA